MTRQLLIETLQVKPSQVGRVDSGHYLIESNGNGALVISLPMTTLNKRNLNDRVYSTAVFESAIPRAKTAMENRELLSSVNEHPSEPYVTPGQASHVVTEMWIDGEHLYGKWEVLETSNGKDLRALIEARVAFGVSIRGLGSMDYQGNILAEDYEILGCDCVGEPSTQLRVRPEIVSETTNKLFTKSHSSSKIKENEMKDKNSVIKYITEQKVLMESEMKSDKVAAFTRAAAVEDALAGSTIQGKELADVYNVWESIKDSCFKQISESKNADEDTTAQLSLFRKVVEKRNTQLNVMGKALTKMTEQLNVTKRLAQKKIVEAVTTVNGKAKTVESQLKAAISENKKLVTENKALKASNDNLLAEATHLHLAYRLAVKEAGRINIGYKIAIKEAAKLAKGKKLIESAFTFFTDADYETFTGADRPFGKMEPMVSEGNNYSAVLAGTDGGTTQVQVFTKDGATWAKDVASWSEFYQFASQLPESVDPEFLKSSGFADIAGFSESKTVSFKKGSKAITESRIIKNGSSSDVASIKQEETAQSRGEVPHAGWI